ncbi:EAL domain-containing protein [Pantoea phytobeneficialis]|uniref:cyclic-guanylate-specific phosphodiesterase n=1 Tax=Pantoea phytobeneficialis TaxID=2052056 RepID=A0AAP9KQU3_9GAMM|nr:EAL domain-containing protein [Pantoea phytobeneficialis]MDO6407849.1 EAL domain-containing protein [Pantoea phytobeneficialis]QGR08399.1 cyclic diguanylate phosphodiesterase [Pantoea phytobeneficialis]
MPPQRRNRDFGWLLIVCAGLLPLVLGILCTAIEARHTVHQQQITTANSLLAQAERMSDSAWDMITELRQFHYQPCSAIEDKLQREGNLNAYFRSIGKLEGDNVTCSSAYGMNPGSLSEMMLRHPPVTGKAWWSISIRGTFGVPNRPAVIFVRQLPDGEGFWAVIDGQYLMDFMRALGESRGYRMTMRFNDGAPITSGPAEQLPETYLKSEPWRAESSRYPISVEVVVPPSELLKAWRQALFIFLPMAAIFSILLMILTANWLRRRISWRDEIRRAMRNRQFSVHYQPVYSMAAQHCNGVEALLRWHLPNGDTIRPDIFISAAEEEGMIVPLTRHLLELMAEDIQSWQVEPGFHIGLNLAAEHLQHPEFVADIQLFARRVQNKKLQITLELTERSLIHDGEDVARKLRLLQLQGMKVAIDDFGTGHCSLSYLQTFPLDYLKIDRGFINAIERLDGETPVLDAIINLAHKLQLEVLGEGVETSLQFQYLQQRGVVFIQGYYYAWPMDNDRLRAWLNEQGQQPLLAEESHESELHHS